jgi:hypothetical protein
MTFTLSGVQYEGGVKQVDCYTSMPDDDGPQYTWVLTVPAGYPEPLPQPSGQGTVVSVLGKVLGTYTCTFTVTVETDLCEPPTPLVRPATKTVTASATLVRNPATITATTDWPDMPPGLNLSDITVTWTPAECVGNLAIVELVGDDGYVPPNNGTLEKENDTLWHYTAFNEPQNVTCPKDVDVWVAAFKGNTELTRQKVLVLPIHRFLTTGANTNFPMDYDYISWKYAAVLATTQGGFGPVTFSADAAVSCRGTLAYACTNIETGAVVFGTSTFTGSENQAASITNQ